MIQRKSTSERQEEIIESVLGLCEKKGLSDISTQQIADRIGISQPTIFRHFKTREKILQAVLDVTSKRLFKYLTEGLSNADTADDKLKVIISRHLTFLSKHKGMPRFLFSDKLLFSKKPIKKLLLRVMARYQGMLGEVIEEGKQRGEYSAALDTEVAAQQILSLVQGTIMQWSMSDFEFDLVEQVDDISAFCRAALYGVSKL